MNKRQIRVLEAIAIFAESPQNIDLIKWSIEAVTENNHRKMMEAQRIFWQQEYIKETF